MLLLCSCSQHAEKYDKATSTEEIPDSPMTSPDSDCCIIVDEAKVPMQSYAGANDISGPEMSGELAVVEEKTTR